MAAAHLHLVTSAPRRPTTRGECIDGMRPCPWFSCRHHLFHGPTVLTAETCSLDIADRGPLTSREVGEFLGLSHGRVQQIEVLAFEKMRKRLPDGMLAGCTHARTAVVVNDGLADIDSDFKAGVARAYERIVPEHERGSSAIRTSRSVP